MRSVNTIKRKGVVPVPHPKQGYYLKNKTRVPGTTTICGRFKDSSALLWWAFGQGKSAERGEINSLYDRRDAAADAGTLAHDMVESHIKNGPMPDLSNVPENIIKQAKQGYENYLNWESTTHIVILEQEIQLVSEKYRFGGCPDAIGMDSKGRICLLDWKTSNGIYPDYLIQLGAYGHLWNFNNPQKSITGGYHLCRFSKEHADFHHHYWSELDDAWEQFKLFRKAYDLDKKLKKRV